MFATLKLWIYRPLQRPRHSPTMAMIPRSRILHVSLEVVEKINRVLIDPSARPFQWLSVTWISWHAFAVIIAELCVHTDGELVERAWSLVNVVFEDTARHIADSHQGRLWRPIKKLMSRALTVRRQHLGHSNSITGCLRPADSRLANQLLSTTNSQLNNLYDAGAQQNEQSDPPVFLQQYQQSSNTTDYVSAGWDPWAAIAPFGEPNYNPDLNRVAWTNWETFIDELQVDESLLPEQIYGLPF